ncbi:MULTISPECIES: hypothetical protein [unclassified Amycolatopsis]|uniref:hypothetical protein n=1 Tax=unclassified Amycolatopsis TaxID=2618356 RepID=UPI0021047A06|nr:hypothetical protein [Amycolatopsis sp. DSM 110486]
MDDQWRSVDDLDADPAWSVTRSPTHGQWLTAEWASGRWLVGLTPVDSGVVAAILWSGDDVIGHARGSEAAMCATCRTWIHGLRTQDAAPAPGRRDAAELNV